MSRRHVVRVLGILSALALVFGGLAGTASARTHHRLSAKQKAHVRAQLRKAIKKNPRLIRKSSFLKKASLVDFKLPVTIRLRTNVVCGSGTDGYPSCAGQVTHVDTAGGALAHPVFNPNNATIDLGPSLGQREIDLQGTLPAEIQFHDTFDGGALGNVDIKILRDTTGNTGLTTTSIPLLWNTQVSNSSTHWFIPGGNAASGCGDFQNAAASLSNPFGLQPFPNSPAQDPTASAISASGYPSTSLGVANPGGALAAVFGAGPVITGVPYVNAATPPQYGGFGLVGEFPGVDAITNLNPGTEFSNLPAGTTVNDRIGGSLVPFPSGVAPTGGGYSSLTNTPPDGPNGGGAQVGGVYNGTDTVLRTGALKLNVSATGPATDGAGNPLNVGPSGGQANLFGNIPGKSVGVDVTVSLDTQINSIIREVDPDQQTLVGGQNWTAQAFQCRQAWTGGVQNYINGVHLTGQLRISPAIDRDGSLRIAKTILSSDPNHPTRIGLAACLMPYVTYANPTGTALSPSGTAQTVPTDPIQETTPTVSGFAQAPGSPLVGVPCNAAPSAEVAAAGVQPLGNASAPYTTTASGALAEVAGDLTVNKIDAEVLIGAPPSSSTSFSSTN